MSRKIEGYKDLVVWQKSMDMVELVYDKTNHFPKQELYGIVSQIRRAGVSIPANIAEGYSRNHKAELIQFLYVSHASASELETLLILSKRLGLIGSEDFKLILSLLDEVQRMLKSLIKSIQRRKSHDS